MEEQKEKIYTIGEIARELGVSTTTVSRAISGKGRISQATRERVKVFVEQHDYSPNALAKGLAKSKTYNLGLVIPGEFDTSEVPFFGACVNGICEMASAYNYDIVISITNGDDLTQMHRQIANRKVDGVILSRAVTGSAAQRFLREKNVPFVVIGPVDDPEVISVDNRNREASRELTGILLMKGIHKLALFGGSERYRVTHSRYQGYLDAHIMQGREADPELIFMDVDNDIKAMKFVEKSLEAGVDGIVCMDEAICNMTLSCLREKGIQIPEEIKLASFYDSKQLEHNMPPVTSLRFDAKGLGINACCALLELLGENVEQERRPLNYQVILRESTK